MLKNVTTRNDPDGRSGLNVNVFTGNVIVTDFGDETGTISNIQKDKLTDVLINGYPLILLIH